MLNTERAEQTERMIKKFMQLSGTQKAFVAGYMVRTEEESEPEDELRGCLGLVLE